MYNGWSNNILKIDSYFGEVVMGQSDCKKIENTQNSLL